MVQSFLDQATHDIFNGVSTRRARKRLPQRLWKVAQRKLDQLDSAETLHDLSVPPGNRLEQLRGDRKGQHSIRINDQYMVRVPTHRPPTHSGEILREEFLRPLDLTQRALAEALRVPYQRINELVNDKRGVTASTALRLGRYFGMSAGYWLSLQQRWDLYKAQQSESEELARIRQRTPAGAE